MPHLILIRGIPGSGKSTFAKVLQSALNCRMVEQEFDNEFDNGKIWRQYENDDYFTGSDGKYNWLSHRVPDAVGYCQVRTINALEKGHNVIVSNTFTKPSDYKWATDLCKEKGYRLTVLTMEGDHGSVHNIPDDKMDYFRRNMRIPYRP